MLKIPLKYYVVLMLSLDRCLLLLIIFVYDVCAYWQSMINGILISSD